MSSKLKQGLKFVPPPADLLSTFVPLSARNQGLFSIAEAPGSRTFRIGQDSGTYIAVYIYKHLLAFTAGNNDLDFALLNVAFLHGQFDNAGGHA
jgi:hypothetical protein